MDLNIKFKTFRGKKKKNKRISLESRVFKEYLDLTTKAQSIKTNKGDVIKLKIFTLLKTFLKAEKTKKRHKRQVI